jgi:hypothetical protein
LIEVQREGEKERACVRVRGREREMIENTGGGEGGAGKVQRRSLFGIYKREGRFLRRWEQLAFA